MTETRQDELRKVLSSVRLQVPTWLAVALFLTAITSSAWFGVTKDSMARWISAGAWLAFAVLVTVLAEHVFRKYGPKETND
jgi:membrane protein YdbS with pleckstrin-like domain